MTKKVYYAINIKDEDDNPIAPYMLEDDDLIALSDRIANGSLAGSIEVQVTKSMKK